MIVSHVTWTDDAEFKGEQQHLPGDPDLVEAAVGLSNRPGGRSAWSLLDVRDDGQVSGAPPRHEVGETEGCP